MPLNGSDGRGGGNRRRTGINLAGEVSFMTRRDSMRGLMQGGVSSTSLLLQSLENNTKLSVEEVLKVIEGVFSDFDLSTLSPEGQELFKGLQAKLESAISGLHQEPDLLPLDAFIPSNKQD